MRLGIIKDKRLFRVGGPFVVFVISRQKVFLEGSIGTFEEVVETKKAQHFC